MLPLVIFLIILITTTMIFWPKGNVVHEVMNLPMLWWKLHNVAKLPSENQKISYGDHYRQYCLRMQPAQGFNPELPVIVYFHGGGWRYGSPENFEANAQPFLNRGHLVFLPSYRRLPFFDYSHMREDLDHLLQLLKSQTQALGLTNPRYIFGGMSAGGNLAAHLALNQPALKSAGWSAEQILGLFLCGAVLDLSKMPDNFVLDQFAGPRTGQKFQEANPVNYIDENTRLQVFCLHGSLDGMVPLACTASFVQQLQTKSKSKVEFLVHPEGTHLDAVQWAHHDGWQREQLMSWVEDLE